MSPSLFRRLCERRRPLLPDHPFDPRGRPALPVRDQLLIALYRLANEAVSVRAIVHAFGVSDGTVSQTCHAVFTALCAHFAPELVRFPTFEDQLSISLELNRMSRDALPGAMGCIDGSHIYLGHYVPFDRDYINRKGYPSVVLQAVCDHHRVIRAYNLSWPGSMHDARVYATSDPGCNIEQVLRPGCYLLGDSGYPSSKQLIIPFAAHLTLSRQETRFNKRLSSVRSLIERTFGALKGRWRRLFKLNFASVEACKLTVVTAIVLHNMCILWDNDACDDFVAPADVLLLDDLGRLFANVSAACADGTELRARLAAAL